jgi:hypothetical protein
VLSPWELAFNRHMEGLLPPTQWDARDISFVNNIPYYLSENQWLEYKNGYGDAFAMHVDAIYSGE